MIYPSKRTTYSLLLLIKMDSYYDYNESREEWVFEMAQDALNTFEDDQEEQDEEDEPSLSASDRNPSLT